MTSDHNQGRTCEMDAWLQDRCQKLSAKMGPHVMAGRSLNDPQFRLWLGQHQAYMHMRSYIHGDREHTERTDSDC